ncbi:group III truncated hemoglobin [Flavobacterium sp.]|uniref:group III truncated hemoglobin n=1 Tax=Flavobacterium sp. TaxID=239 RepID=UPI0026241840|nr:group III truncated hemoglobin [Flavobacterium sp.]
MSKYLGYAVVTFKDFFETLSGLIIFFLLLYFWTIVSFFSQPKNAIQKTFNMKTDIKNRKDIEILVNTFYDRIKNDDVIGYLFNDVAQVNWEIHLPKMYNFWENILFFTANYEGNPMARHKELHQKSPMIPSHFRHWNKLFTETVDKLFEGQKAEEIKNRALNISAAMMYKTLSS